MSDTDTRPTTRPTERTAGGTTVVTLSGDVDLVTALSLGPRLDVLTAGPRPNLVLDLRQVPFVDCAGLGLLCRARNRVAAREGRLWLVTGSASFRRLLHHSGLADAFHLVPEPADIPAA
ncbi:STAS domain-containing protein [Streptomyces sp. MMS24-I31]|uniref:STAS domain-containing protein n=1 Tax=Streptomyces sp. MMS24-I31 TaxID=3351563 RepID=UPI00389693E1